MTCIKIQSMITPFINDELAVKDMEIFLDHIAGCKNCREELEFYYALLTAMKQLDEDQELTGDFEQELTDKLEKAQEKVIHTKYTYYRKKAILVLAIIVLAFLINLGYTGDKPEKESNATVSDFRIRKAFQGGQNDIIDMQLQNYLREHQIIPVPIDE